MKATFAIALFFLCLCYGWAQEGYPAPKPHANSLFFIQHSLNHNTYVYDANIKNGSFDKKKPIDIYRILFADKGQKKKLTEIQRDFAYGMKLRESNENEFVLTLAADKKLPFHLIRDTENPAVYVNVNDRKMYVDRMFVKIKGKGRGLSSRAEYILIYGRDFDSNQELTERVDM